MGSVSRNRKDAPGELTATTHRVGNGGRVPAKAAKAQGAWAAWAEGRKSPSPGVVSNHDSAEDLSYVAAEDLSYENLRNREDVMEFAKALARSVVEKLGINPAKVPRVMAMIARTGGQP